MFAGMKIERRVVALEQRKRARQLVQIPMIATQIGETEDEAVARYVAEQGALPELDEGDVNIIVLVPVAPTRWAA